LRFLPLILANLRRSPLRSVLTAAAIAFAIALVCLLRTMPEALEWILDYASSGTRVVVVNKAGFDYPLPYAYLQKIRARSGVASAVSWTWYGGIDLELEVDRVHAAAKRHAFADLPAVAPERSETGDRAVAVALERRDRLGREGELRNAKQAASADSLYIVVGGLAVLAGIGAAFGASNTFYAAVQARTREIGTLRALGFSRAAIAGAFLLESLLVALAGFLLGSALALLCAAAISAAVGEVSTFATSGVTLVALRVGASDLAFAFALALAIGLGGALLPARRAARLRPIEAMRKG
jgi:cell division protein FtsX